MARIKGFVISCYPSASKYGGSFGEILGDDGKHYVFEPCQVLLNFSDATVGARVEFDAAEHYARRIDQLNKPAPKRAIDKDIADDLRAALQAQQSD